jgi:hypothetical protein
MKKKIEEVENTKKHKEEAESMIEEQNMQMLSNIQTV